MERRIGIVSIILAFLLALLVACSINIYTPYEFRQEADQIMGIEILKQDSVHVSWDERFVVRGVLNEEVYAHLLSDLQSVEGNDIYMPPSMEFGPFLIRITYSDGEIELIGIYNNAYITADGRAKYDTYRFLDEAAYFEVISKYLDEDISYEAEVWTGF